MWPGPVPGEKEPIGEEKATKKAGTNVVTGLTNVSKPTLLVAQPPRDKNTGVAILVFPGGGYNMLAWDHEGEQVARWLNSIGVTAAVLKYRVPRRPGTAKGEPPIQALMDAQRAISLVRSKASDWGVDSKRIGVLGFSAGGHPRRLGPRTVNPDKRSYETIDAVDKINCRPDFAVIIYPGGVPAQARLHGALARDPRHAADSPPWFFVHAANDSAENSIHMYLALRKAKVPAELHIYGSGGHGFGLRPGTKPAASWPKQLRGLAPVIKTS